MGLALMCPELAGRPCGYVNTNEFSLATKFVKPVHLKEELASIDPLWQTYENPWIAPRLCDVLMRDFHEMLNLYWSYGGWLEVRSTMLRGTYLDESGNYLHLGVDVNVPLGTKVAVSEACTIVDVLDDSKGPTPEKWGWGGRALVRLTKRPHIYIAYAHLRLDPMCRRGVTLLPGTVLGTAAPHEGNGYWFVHVHVQTLTEAAYQHYFVERREVLDGYGHPKRRTELSKLHPDPLQYIRLF